MTSRKEKELRTKLNNKIISLVKPVDMSIDEYRIACNLENINPSIENGMYLHWIMTADGDADVCEKVENAIVNALEKRYLLDSNNKEQISYFCDAIKNLVLRDKDYTIRLLEAVLKNYKGTEVFDFCKRVNKCIGLTSVEYFNYDALKEHIKNAIES